MKCTTGFPAYRIRTPRLLLACWEPGMAAQLRDAVAASRGTLLPWMPWADMPGEVDDRLWWIRHCRSSFDTDKEYVYAVRDPAGKTVLGGCGLHTGHGDDALMIGYWIASASQGRGYATELTRALLYTAFATTDINRVVIQAVPENRRSVRVIEKCGFTFQGTLKDATVIAAGQVRDLSYWRMSREEFAASPATGLEVIMEGPDGRILG